MSAVKLFLYKKIEAILSFVIAICTPAAPFMILTGGVVLLDAITGVKASLKRGEVFSSKRLKDTVTKTLVYQLALLIAYGIDLVFEIGIILKVLGAFIVYTELKSIDENWFTISGNRLFKNVINKIPNMNKEQNKSNGGNKKFRD